MSEQAIEQAILSVLSDAKGRWRKVAMVIGKVAKGIGSELAEGDEGHEQVARRIEVLVNEGRLEAQGDVRNWRFSEVRLPN